MPTSSTPEPTVDPAEAPGRVGPLEKLRTATLALLPGLAVAIISVGLSAVTSIHFANQAEEIERPQIEATIVSWYNIVFEESSNQQLAETPAGTPIAVLNITNTGRNAMTVTNVEQHTGRKSIPVLGTVLVRSDTAVEPQHQPIFKVDGGETVVALLPIASVSYFGTDIDTLTFTLHNGETEIHKLDDFATPTAKNEQPGSCFKKQSASCIWAAVSMHRALAQFDDEFWNCSSKAQILTQLPVTQGSSCKAWLIAEGWLAN